MWRTRLPTELRNVRQAKSETCMFSTEWCNGRHDKDRLFLGECLQSALFHDLATFFDRHIPQAWQHQTPSSRDISDRKCTLLDSTPPKNWESALRKTLEQLIVLYCRELRIISHIKHGSLSEVYINPNVLHAFKFLFYKEYTVYKLNLCLCKAKFKIIFIVSKRSDVTPKITTRRTTVDVEVNRRLNPRKQLCAVVPFCKLCDMISVFFFGGSS
jgi:hypothetical protein